MRTEPADRDRLQRVRDRADDLAGRLLFFHLVDTESWQGVDVDQAIWLICQMNHGLEPQWLENLPLKRFLKYYDWGREAYKQQEQAANKSKR